MYIANIINNLSFVEKNVKLKFFSQTENRLFIHDPGIVIIYIYYFGISFLDRFYFRDLKSHAINVFHINAIEIALKINVF